jgi:hypothetical protein
MQYVLHQQKIELRTRSMSHLLSSVDPVLYCATNGQLTLTARRLFFSLVSSAASLFRFFAWAIADCALHCLYSQSGAFTVCALLQQAALWFVSFIMLHLVL